MYLKVRIAVLQPLKMLFPSRQLRKALTCEAYLLLTRWDFPLYVLPSNSPCCTCARAETVSRIILSSCIQTIDDECWIMGLKPTRSMN